MKKLEFKTSKGRFLLVDLPNLEDIAKELQIFGHDIGLTTDDLNNYFKHILPDFKNSYDVSETTEEQASEIVESHKNCKRYYFEKTTPQKYYNTAIESLHSLLKSKGIHLFDNPFYHGDLEDYAKYQEEEQKTFYNPYIFKL